MKRETYLEYQVNNEKRRPAIPGAASAILHALWESLEGIMAWNPNVNLSVSRWSEDGGWS